MKNISNIKHKKMVNGSLGETTKNVKPNMVNVDPKVFADIRKFTLRSGTNETGGLLLGKKIKTNNKYVISIQKATGPGLNADVGTYHFSPDIKHYKNEMRSELYMNGLIYIGEWHKHPGSFDRPSSTDLKTMRKITSDRTNKDMIVVIATIGDQSTNNVKTDYFYYHNGMEDFIGIKPNIISMAPLRQKLNMVKKINLETNYLMELIQSNADSIRIKGKLTDNNIVNIFSGSRAGNEITGRILLNNNKGHDISLETINEDLIIVYTPDHPVKEVSAWQLNDKNGDMDAIDIDLIDIKKNLYKRLGGLNINTGLSDKKVTLIGVGSVGSTAAAQFVKAGVTDITLIDPDHLEIHNIVRHLCDLNDLGRYKVDAVAERLQYINPQVKVQKLRSDYINDYDDIMDKISDTDVMIVSTDTPDSRAFSNMKSVEMNIPAVFISLHERAKTGSVYRIVPGITGCRNCIGDGRWGHEFIPGTTEYSNAKDERDILFQPGLDTDISLVTLLGVKMSISTILNPEASITPDLGTNYLHWNGYPDGNSPMVKIIEGIGIPKNDHCDICKQAKQKKKNIFDKIVKKVRQKIS